MVIYDILTRCELERPDNRPIYAYSLTNIEFAALSENLRSKTDRRATDWSSAEAAEFCIFIAEWWRRSFSGGHWKYVEPTQEIALERWPTTHYHDLIERGLAYLGRELIELDGGRQFLGTLATEGGLPLQMVVTESGRLAAAFRAMFDEIRIFGANQLSPLELGQQQMERFPQTFQQAETIPLLLGQIALVVWDYAHLVEEEENPVAALETKYPDWRADLPLQVREQQARALLETVLGEAHEARVDGDNQFGVVRRIVNQQGEWTLSAAVEAPSHVLEGRLERLLGVDEGALPYRLKLKVQTGGEQRLFALASRARDSYRIETTADRPIFLGETAAGSIRLVAYAGENEYGDEQPLLSEALGDEPWIFSPESDASPLQLFSTGSIRSRREDVLVAVDRRSKIEANDTGAFESIFMLGDRQVVRVLGQASFTDPDGTLWRIRCAQKTNAYLETHLRGERWDLHHARGLPVYSLLPQVRVDRDILDAHDVKWVSHHQQTSLVHAPPGDGRLRVRDEEGAVVMQRRICRLPPEASIEVCPALDNQPGFLRLRNFGDVQVGSAHDDVTVHASPAGANQVEVRFEVGAQPAPSAINLVLKWSKEAQTTLKVPFPQEEARFVARDRVLPNQGSWIAHSLEMLQAEVTPADGYLGSEPVVEGQLIAWDANQDVVEATRFEVSLKPEYIGRQLSGRHILSLGRLREHVDLALAGTMDVSGRVELTLSWPGSVWAQQRHLRLYRYEGQIERSGSNLFLPQFRNQPVKSWGPLRLVAFRFQDTSEVHELQPTTDADWIAPMAEWKPGTWCVLGIRDGRMSHLPCIFTIEGDYESTEWAEVCELPDRDQRRQAFFDLYKRAAADPQMQVWNELTGIFELASELPATTFDALDCLTMVPGACAMAFLKAGVTRIERWWSELEELPFSWHVISIADWRRAIEAVCASVEEQATTLDFEISVTSYLEHAAEHICRNLGGHSPLFTYLDEHLKLGLGLPNRDLQFARNNDAFLKTLFRDEFNNLLRRRDPDHYRWPQWALPQGVEEISLFSEVRLAQQDYWRRPVSDAPVVAAVACALDLTLSRAEVLHLRRLRNFDRQWFDFAYRVSLARAIAQTPDEQLLG